MPPNKIEANESEQCVIISTCLDLIRKQPLVSTHLSKRQDPHAQSFYSSKSNILHSAVRVHNIHHLTITRRLLALIRQTLTTDLHEDIILPQRISESPKDWETRGM